MSGLKPDITDEEIGIRSFQLRKGRAVERAMDKIRQRMARKWPEIPSQDVELLKWALGETWALMGQYEWDRIYFSNMDMPTMAGIIEVARQILGHNKVGYQGFEEIHQTLKSLESKTVQPS